MVTPRTAGKEQLPFEPALVVVPARDILALGLWQRRPGGFVFPNQVVEGALGVLATTRWWETVERVAEILGGP